MYHGSEDDKEGEEDAIMGMREGEYGCWRIIVREYNVRLFVRTTEPEHLGSLNCPCLGD